MKEQAIQIRIELCVAQSQSPLSNRAVQKYRSEVRKLETENFTVKHHSYYLSAIAKNLQDSSVKWTSCTDCKVSLQACKKDGHLGVAAKALLGMRPKG